MMLRRKFLNQFLSRSIFKINIVNLGYNLQQARNCKVAIK